MLELLPPYWLRPFLRAKPWFSSQLCHVLQNAPAEIMEQIIAFQSLVLKLRRLVELQRLIALTSSTNKSTGGLIQLHRELFHSASFNFLPLAGFLKFVPKEIEWRRRREPMMKTIHFVKESTGFRCWGAVASSTSSVILFAASVSVATQSVCCA